MSISPLQIILIILVVLFLFGAGRIPKLMRDLAEGIKAFKKGLNEEEKPSKPVRRLEKIKSSSQPKSLTDSKTILSKKTLSKKKSFKKTKK